MANEYQYAVTLCIRHPSINAETITNTLAYLKPEIESTIGSDRRKQNGDFFVPRRKAQFTYWAAPLSGGERLDSGNYHLTDFLDNQLAQLEVHRVFLEELVNTGGQISLSIWWFCPSNLCADIVAVGVLARLAALRIELELNVMLQESADGTV